MLSTKFATSCSTESLQRPRVHRLRQNCLGLTPLGARLESWMEELCKHETLSNLLDQYGSPLNVLATEPFRRNIDRLYQLAEKMQIDFDVYFARKANKCLGFVKAAKSIGCGIDTASEQELEQVLRAGISPAKIICTAAIKNQSLLMLCINRGITIAIDNQDELGQVQKLAGAVQQQPLIALRVSGFEHRGEKLFSRFGVDIDKVLPFVRENGKTGSSAYHPKLVGIHFHLDGYVAEQRVAAIRQLLPIIDQLRAIGHPIRFLDLGGGFPMSYLESKTEWDHFWKEHQKALLGSREPLTYRNHGLGLLAVEGKIAGKRKSYPYFQSPVQADWLAIILEAEYEAGTIATAFQKRDLQLRCEPGRSILDGCGLTAARVEFCKQHPEGFWLIGLAMNHTQCRTSSDDFLVDPLLVRQKEPKFSTEIEGFVVGAYCTESELLCLRRLRFPHGITPGDIIIFPNTAGYLMHFLESRSHQFPLAKNLIALEDSKNFELDEIDR
ncbi:Diaminopimelate decarboxylase [Planctomycetales bacterium 10988]|nr:Diaminopimelate decarboxylase [Planctomycetales bacterium 10988]